MFGLNAVGQRNFDASIACPVISGVALALRLYCKTRYQRTTHADDYWMILSTLTAWASACVAIYGGVEFGKGRELEDILMAVYENGPADKSAEYMLYAFLSWILYLAAAFCVKVSVLLFYRRVFVITNYQRVSLALIVFVSLWFVASIITALLACVPLDAFWHPLNPNKKCLNLNIYVLSINLFDALSDMAIMLLPMRVVFTLHVEKRTKVALGGIFALAGLVVVTNFLRVGYMYRPHSKLVRYNDALLWTNIHLVTAHLCACLPIYKPLWTSLSRRLSKLVSRSSESKDLSVPDPVFLKSFRVRGRNNALKVLDLERGSLAPDGSKTTIATTKSRDEVSTIEIGSDGSLELEPASCFSQRLDDGQVDVGHETTQNISA